MSLWIAPYPYAKSRGYVYNFLTPWRWRGVSWRLPMTRKLGWLIKAENGRWYTHRTPAGIRAATRAG